jgi:MATE family multidrug resistance protein
VADEAWRLIGLAWPVVLTSLNWTLMHLIDVLIVGRAGPDQLGALAAGRALTFITIVIGIAALTGIIVFTARYDGAREYARCGDVLREGLLAALALGLPAAALMYAFSVEITRGIGIAPRFVAEGAGVVGVMAFAFPAQLCLTAMAYFMEGASRPQRAMIVNLVMLPLNALLAWAWVDGHFGLPANGAIGAVSATAVVSGCGALLMVLSVATLDRAAELNVRDISWSAWLRAVKGVPRLIGFGIVPGIASGLEMAGFSILISLSTRLGAVATAAFQTVFSLHNFLFAIGIGMASAAGVRAGNAVGEGQPREAFARVMVAGGLLAFSMGGIAVAYMIFRHPLVDLFSVDPAVRALSATMLLMLAPFALLDGLQLVFVYALRSLGDQVIAGINGIIAFFLLTGAMGWWLVMVRQDGPFALIFAAAAGMVCAALLQGARFAWVSRRYSRS